MKKFLISYLIAVGGMVLLLKFDILAEFSNHLSLWLAHAAAYFIQFIDSDLVQNGAILRHGIAGAAIEVTEECNALEATLLLFIAILTFPAPWKYKLYGIVLGLLTLQGLNVIRLISLYYVIDAYPQWFDFIHEYLWRGFIFLDMMLAFAAWVFFSVRGQKQALYAS